MSFKTRTRTVPPSEKLPPHSPEAEQGALGCAMLGDHQATARMVAQLAGEGIFYDLRHKAIYDTIAELWEARQPVDLIVLRQRLSDKKMLDQIGGLTYLMKLPNTVPSAANLDYYVQIVVEKATLRRLQQTCRSYEQRIHEHTGTIEELVDEWQRDALRVSSALVNNNGPADIRAVQMAVMDKYDEAVRHGRAMGLLSGFRDLDRKAGGMMGSEVIIIGGRPSSGKTTLALNIGVNAANNGTTVAVYSLETSIEKLVHRFQCCLGRANGSGFRNGQVTEEDIRNMTIGAGKLTGLKDKLLLYNKPLTDLTLASQARDDYQRGARLFILDYLQLMGATGDGDTERATAASKAIKRVAQELNCPFIVISSLRRPDAKAPNREPSMSDLRQSGQIEFDADKMLLLSCKGDDAEADIREVTCHVAKNKDGPLGDLSLTLFAQQFRFESAAMDVPEPQPSAVDYDAVNAGEKQQP